MDERDGFMDRHPVAALAVGSVLLGCLAGLPLICEIARVLLARAGLL